MKYENLSRNIKKYRKEMGLTQKALGEKIFKSEIAIRKYESGSVNIPVSTLFDLSSALNIPAKVLLGSDITDYTNENLSSVLSTSNSVTKKLLQINEETRAYGDSWRDAVLEMETNPAYLLNTILIFLENTEQYYSPIFVDVLNKKDPELPYFTHKQINDIMKKVTELVKYEIYKIENDQ